MTPCNPGCQVHLSTHGREVPDEEGHQHGCRIREPGGEDETRDPDEEKDKGNEGHQKIEGDGPRHEEDVVFVGLGQDPEKEVAENADPSRLGRMRESAGPRIRSS